MLTTDEGPSHPDGQVFFTTVSIKLPTFWSLQFGSRCFERSFFWQTFLCRAIGSDFISWLILQVPCLLHSSTLESIPAILSSSSTALLSTPEEFRDLLSEYPDVVSSKGFFTTDPKHSVRHTVPTLHSPPVFAKACRISSPAPRLSFSAIHPPCLWSLFLLPAPIFSVTRPQVSSAPWF